MTASQIPVLLPLSGRPLSLCHAEPLPAEADTVTDTSHLRSTSPDGSLIKVRFQNDAFLLALHHHQTYPGASSILRQAE